MIINIENFIHEEKRYWTELEKTLDNMEESPIHSISLKNIQRFHYVYQRTSAALAKIQTFASEPETVKYLESLVARAYGEIHETRGTHHRFRPFHWFFTSFPATFRKHIRAFWLVLAITFLGGLFGIMALLFDPDSKEVIMPFSNLLGSPSERVEKEESSTRSTHGGGIAGTSFYFTHNTRVSINILALGITYGVGSIILLFYNGVILGAVIIDYIMAGETVFLMGWLLPHGVIELPAVFIAGQAALVLAGALIGWGKRISLKERLRSVTKDLIVLIFGVAVLLLWAGFVESFLSQYHEPIIPYSVKILFGIVELTLLIFFLLKGGKKVKV